MHRIILIIVLLVSVGLCGYYIYNNSHTSSFLNQFSEVRSASDTTNNVLVFLIDDLDTSSFNLMLKNGKLPNIQALINDGAQNFSNSFVVNSTCCPSRATFMTGKYSHNTGVYNVAGSNGTYTAFKNKNENVANWLSDTHNTAFIGKFMVGAKTTGSNRISCDSNSDFPGWDYFELISGYNGTPGAWSSSNCTQTAEKYPFMYQPKYIANATNSIINNIVSKQAQFDKDKFFVVVAPTTPHVEVSQWKLRSQVIGSQIKQSDKPSVNDSDPIVSYNQLVFPSGPDTGKDYQVVVKGTPGNGYTQYRRVSLIKNTDDYYQYPVGVNTGWSSWENLGQIVDTSGRSSIRYSKTGSFQGLNTAFKTVNVNGSTFKLRYGHVLYNNSMFYTEELVDNNRVVAQPWVQIQVNGNADLNSIFQGTNPTDPIVEFATTELPNQAKVQVLIRGTAGKNYRKYYRYNVNNKWTQWQESPLGWDLATKNDNQIVGYSTSVRGNDLRANRFTEAMVRYVGNDTYNIYEYKTPNLSRVFSAASNCRVADSENTNVLAATTSSQNTYSSDMNYSGYSATEANRDSQAASQQGMQAIKTPAPHIYHAGRQIADGNWDFHDAFASKCLTFSSNSYAGGRYPAGTLRSGGNKNGFTPANSAFGLPQTPALNAVDPTKPAWITRNYPDLNSNVYSSNLTQREFATRFWLDRNEALMSVDAMVGDVVKNMKSKGIYDDTLIIFTSDNGHMNGEFRLQNKQVAYESSIRVPLIVKLPRSEQASSIKTPARLVANIDIAPTILDYAGKNWETYPVDGRSLRPILAQGIADNAMWRKSILIEREYPKNFPNLMLDDWAWGMASYDAIRTLDFSTGAATPTSYKYIKYKADPIPNGTDSNKEELYNLSTDKYEMKNIVGSSAQIKANLQNKMNALKVCSKESCRTADK